tara:strand:+ start:220 stop:513 length:294 start_codon:yes stop_codon:yes gene_type:complete
MFKNSFFKLDRNKKFNYNPRYLKDNKYERSYSFNSRIKSSREDFVSSDRSSFWKEERVRRRIKENRSFNKLFLIILFLLFFMFFYIIDFDFSIFKKY